MNFNRRIYLGLAALAIVFCAGFFLARSLGSQPLASAGRTDETTSAPAGNRPSPSIAQKRTGIPKPEHGEDEPLPDSHRPLKDRFADLQALAYAGNATAARRLYHDLNVCTMLAAVDVDNTRLADELLGTSVATMDVQQLQDYQTQLDAIEMRKTNMQRLHEMCDGTSRQMFDALVPTLQRAAELGDADARACYLSRGPNFDMRGFLAHPEFLEEYRSSATAMIDAGLAAGDWKVVDLMRSAYQPGAQSLLAGVTGTDPLRYYRYLKLYRLGAEPYRAGELDAQLKAAAAKLSPGQVADSDAWAQATLQQNFAANPNSTEKTVAGWDPCSFPYDGPAP